VLGLRLYTSLFSCRLPRLGLKRDDQGGVLGEVLQGLFIEQSQKQEKFVFLNNKILPKYEIEKQKGFLDLK
jgi:hypothetical protein